MKGINMNDINYEKDRIESVSRIDSVKSLSDKVIELKRIEDEINGNGGDMIEGVKNTEIDIKNKVPIWAIIRRYNKDTTDRYNKKIDVFIESTSKFIPEYLVSYELLVEKCKTHKLELVESELFSEYFNKIKSEIPDDDSDKEAIHKIVMELDKDPVQKKFSFFNRWCIFKKV